MRMIYLLCLIPFVAFADDEVADIEVLKNQVTYITQQQLPQQIQSLEQEVQGLRGELEQLRYQIAQFKKQKEQSVESQSNDQHVYKSAVDALQKKQYAQATEKFNHIVNKMPKSSLVPNAHYWLGEIDLLYNRYTQAMQHFEYLLERYPQHAKVPDALLKLSLAEIETGRHEVAKTHLSRIVSQHPRSTAAHMARLQLKRLDTGKS